VTELMRLSDEQLREMIAFMAQRLMDADVPGQVGAGPGERSETRENWRNGYRDRLVALVISTFLAYMDWITQQGIGFPGAV
jgi:transposase-like protein